MKAGETGAPAHRSVARGVCVCVRVQAPHWAFNPLQVRLGGGGQSLIVDPPTPRAPRVRGPAREKR